MGHNRATTISKIIHNLEEVMRWTCPTCDQTVHPVFGHTLIQEGALYRMKCPTCERGASQ
jgi:predicted RNA-binding Zn-ribbon protein involved in translation (DUF1610 family)